MSQICQRVLPSCSGLRAAAARLSDAPGVPARPDTSFASMTPRADSLKASATASNVLSLHRGFLSIGSDQHITPSPHGHRPPSVILQLPGPTNTALSSGLDFIDLYDMDRDEANCRLLDAATFRTLCGGVTSMLPIPATPAPISASPCTASSASSHAPAGIPSVEDLRPSFNLKQLRAFRDHVTRNLAPTVAQGFVDAAARAAAGAAKAAAAAAATAAARAAATAAVAAARPASPDRIFSPHPAPLSGLFSAAAGAGSGSGVSVTATAAAAAGQEDLAATAAATATAGAASVAASARRERPQLPGLDRDCGCGGTSSDGSAAAWAAADDCVADWGPAAAPAAAAAAAATAGASAADISLGGDRAQVAMAPRGSVMVQLCDMAPPQPPLVGGRWGSRADRARLLRHQAGRRSLAGSGAAATDAAAATSTAWL